MASYDEGKDFVVGWINEHISKEAKVLDVGACDGKWRKLLPNYPNMDAVEVFEPNITGNHLEQLYNEVFCADICDFKYDHYDLVIFGDIIEHLTVEQAQAVLEYANGHCDQYIVAVPYLYPQGALYGNEHERHLQPDLTPEIVLARYPYLVELFRTKTYGYYTRGLI